MKKWTNIAALSIVAALCGLGFVAPAKADAVRFNNLNAATVDADSIATYGPIAGSFSTAEYASTLTQLSFKLSGSSDNGSVTVQLLSDSSISPGSLLNTIGTINDTSLRSNLANYSLTPATPFSLAANTRYWIRLTSNNSSANWAWSQDVSGPGVAREYIANTNGVFANSSEAPYQMQVLTSTPEPASCGILGLAILGVIGAVRKSRQKKERRIALQLL